jgi:HEAT repeat protein
MRPPAIPLDVTLGLVIGAQALLLALAALVVVRKFRRDHRERASVRRRAEFAAAIVAGSRDDLIRAARASTRHLTALIDLLYVLQRGEVPAPARSAALLDAATHAGLVGKLHRDLGARRSTTRGLAALALSVLRVPGVETGLARLISDSDPDVRLAACNALAKLGTAAAAAALIEALDRFDLPPERIVEKLGSAWAAPVVCAVLQDAMRQGGAECVSPERLKNRVQLVRALELAAFQEAEPELLKLLASGDAEEQIGAARALGSAGSRRSIPALIGALGSHNWPLRAQAARALGRLAAVEAMPQLASSLSDPAWWVRKQAGRALVALGPVGGYGLLEDALLHEDRYARDRAAEELRLVAVSRHASGGAVLTPAVGASPPDRFASQGRAA